MQPNITQLNQFTYLVGMCPKLSTIVRQLTIFYALVLLLYWWPFMLHWTNRLIFYKQTKRQQKIHIELIGHIGHIGQID